MTIEHDDDNFLSRWSKRKLNAEQHAEQHQPEQTEAHSEPVEAEQSQQAIELTEEKPVWQQQDADPLTKFRLLEQIL